MSRYAANTAVSSERSKVEIEKLITRYGATSTAFMIGPGRAMILFEAHERRVLFELPLPDIDDDRFRLGAWKKPRSREKQAEAWEQGCRQAWRALALVIKAKLEAVESGITTFEDEFLAHIVMPDGMTVGRHVKPAVAAWYAGGTMRPLLPAPGKHT